MKSINEIETSHKICNSIIAEFLIEYIKKSEN